MNTVFTKAFDPPPIDKNEILRYAGAKEALPQIEKLIDECISESIDKLTYKVCYSHLPLSFSGDVINLSFTKVKSDSLRRNLSGCRSFLLFAATVGIEIDRLILKYGRISPSKALIFQAIGAERIESLCNEFSLFAEKEFGHTVPRFSPGYGDLPLDVQRDFFRVLEPSRKIGLTLNESMLMTPSKSVTAIIGISPEKRENINHNCRDCDKGNCNFRRNI